MANWMNFTIERENFFLLSYMLVSIFIYFIPFFLQEFCLLLFPHEELSSSSKKSFVVGKFNELIMKFRIVRDELLHFINEIDDMLM